MTETQTPTVGAFRPRARLVRTLGADLISGEIVAIVELVKNSYDADATTCLVRFDDGQDGPGASSVEVLDDGHGMSPSDVSGPFLDLAAVGKSAASTSPGPRRSPSGRILLGEKGIGRLAAARVARECLVRTRQEGGPETTLLIDWAEFERPGAYLDEVPVEWESGMPDYFKADGAAVGRLTEALASAASTGELEDLETHNPGQGHGTSLLLTGVLKDWDKDALNQLEYALSRLVRPDVAEFAIVLSFPEGDIRTTRLIRASEELHDPPYRILGTVSADGVANLRYVQRAPSLSATLQKNVWAEGGRTSPPSCGAFELDLKVWDRDRWGLDRLGVNDKVRDFRERLDPLAGISVFRDGFRIFPYGEAGDDWLELDARRVNNPTKRVSNSQVVGSVLITDSGNPGLRDQSNREGLQHGEALADFRELVRRVLTELENRRYESRRRPRTPADPVGIFAKFELADIVSLLALRYPEDHDVRALVAAKQEQIRQGVEEAQQVISRFHLLGTLGLVVDEVVHDGKHAVGSLRTSALTLKGVLEQDCESLRLQARRTVANIDRRTNNLDHMFEKVEPLSGRRRGRPRDQSLKVLVEDAVAVLDSAVRTSGATLVVAGDDLTVRLDSNDIVAIVVNLLANALYWVQSVDRNARTVWVRFGSQDSGTAFISVADSGPGVPEENRESIFDPYFSTRENGVGLGLTIAGSAAERYGGELVYQVSEAPGADREFRATFRKGIQQ